MTSPRCTAAAGDPVKVRRARSTEGPVLSDLAFRSKAYWGYDAAFMEACRSDLTVSATDISNGHVYVLEQRGRPIGYYRLDGAGEVVTLVDLFVDPGAIGAGHGRRLWNHAVRTAARLGFRALVLQSDPHAEAFYLAMGAQRVGDSPSAVFDGRTLPLMGYSVQ